LKVAHTGVKSGQKTTNSDQKTKKVEKSEKFRLTHFNICATNRLWRSKNGNSDTKTRRKPCARPKPFSQNIYRAPLTDVPG